MERISKLRTYEEFHHATPLRENLIPETRTLGHLEEGVEDDLTPENQHKLIADYITITNIYRMRTGQKKENDQKEIKEKKSQKLRV